MKLHHIAALALASWYLLIPMFDPRSGRVVPLPISQWNEEGIFDSAAECAAAKRNLVEDYKRNKASRAIQEVISSQGACVLSDDPRLAGKVPYSLGPAEPTPLPGLPAPSGVP